MKVTLESQTRHALSNVRLPLRRFIVVETVSIHIHPSVCKIQQHSPEVLREDDPLLTKLIMNFFDPVKLVQTVSSLLTAPAWVANVSQLDPKSGDLIEFQRKGYCHWALYWGDKKIIHFNPSAGEFDKNNANKFVDGKISIDSLEKIAGTSQTRINNKSSTHFSCESFATIKKNGEALLNNPNSKLYYHLIQFNCEHFVTFLRFGIAFSEQEEDVHNLLGTIMPSPIPIFGKSIQQLAMDVSMILKKAKCQKQWEENLEAAKNRKEPKFLM